MKKRATSFLLALLMTLTLLGNGIPVYAEATDVPAVSTEETINKTTEDDISSATPSEAESSALPEEAPEAAPPVNETPETPAEPPVEETGETPETATPGEPEEDASETMEEEPDTASPSEAEPPLSPVNANLTPVKNLETNEYYDNLSNAIVVAQNGDTLEVFGDVTETSTIIIDKSLTIIPGATVTVTAPYIDTKKTCGFLTLGKNGAAIAGENDVLTFDVKNGVSIMSKTFNMHDGIILNINEGSVRFGETVEGGQITGGTICGMNGKNKPLVLMLEATLDEISGGTFEVTTESSVPEVNVAGHLIQMQYSTIKKISGGTFSRHNNNTSGDTLSVQWTSRIDEISGGTFVNDGKGQTITIVQGSSIGEISGGDISANSGVAVWLHAAYGASPKIEKITGGTIRSDRGIGLEVDVDGSVDTISGGTISGYNGILNVGTIGEITSGVAVNGKSIAVWNYMNSGKIKTISGGTFEGGYGLYSDTGTAVDTITGGNFISTKENTAAITMKTTNPLLLEPSLTVDPGFCRFVGTDVSGSSIRDTNDPSIVILPDGYHISTTTMELTVGEKTYDAHYLTLGRYQIAFNSNDGTGGTMKALTGLEYGATVTLNENAFTKDGYYFTGWNTAADGTGKAYTDKSSFTLTDPTSLGFVDDPMPAITATLTLYAQWKSTTPSAVAKQVNFNVHTLVNGTNGFANKEMLEQMNPVLRAEDGREVKPVRIADNGFSFDFENVPAGEYTLIFTYPAGYRFAPGKVGSDMFGDYSDTGTKVTVTTGNVVNNFYTRLEKDPDGPNPPAENTGNLTVTKTVSGSRGDQNKEFTFTVTLDKKDFSGQYGDMTFANGVATFTLKHGQSKTATKIPAGVSYTVEESDNSGYTVTKTNTEGTIQKGMTATAAFENYKGSSGGSGGSSGGNGGSSSHTPQAVRVTLTATKTLDSLIPAGSGFTFFLDDANGQRLQMKNNQNGNITFDAITFNKTGTYVYYLTEQTGSDKNINYDTASYKVTITVTCPYDYEANVSYEKNGQAYHSVPAFANTTKPSAPEPTQTLPVVTPSRPLDKVPKTEDSSNLALWGILAVASLLSLIALLVGNRMRNSCSQSKRNKR